MKTALLLSMAILISLFFLTGCADSQPEGYSVTEAPGIRITSEAMEVINNHIDAYNLSYTQRAS